MSPELFVLLLAVALAIAQLILYAVPGNLELGARYTAGPRDTPPHGHSVRSARIKRAYDNHLETLPWFAIVVIVAYLTNKTDAVTTAAAWTYLVARIAYIPLYVFGVFALRSLVWAVAFFAIITILVRTLL